MRMLDTDVLIDIQRGHSAATAWFKSLSDIPRVPGFVVMELVQSARNLKQVRDVLKLTSPLPVAWPGEQDCNHAMHLFSAHNLTDGIGLLDSLIAWTAISANATLVTFNVKHYRVIPGLTTEQPYVR